MNKLIINNITPEESNYFSYIREHQENIMRAWKELIPKLTGVSWLDDFTFHSIDNLVKIHDESKFSQEEFEGYRQWFYPAPDEVKNKDRFEQAWLHHKNHNPHHWNYWLLDTKPLSMPFMYIVEMLLDWKAMSYKFNDCPVDYWLKNKDSMILHEDTIKCVERWIDLFKV